MTDNKKQHQFILNHKELGIGTYASKQKVNELNSPLQDSLLRILQHSGAITRRDIIKQLGNFPRTTVYDNLLKLQRAKLVTKFSRNAGNRGRPLVYWRLR